MSFTISCRYKPRTVIVQYTLLRRQSMFFFSSSCFRERHYSMLCKPKHSSSGPKAMRTRRVVQPSCLMMCHHWLQRFREHSQDCRFSSITPSYVLAKRWRHKENHCNCRQLLPPYHYRFCQIRVCEPQEKYHRAGLQWPKGIEIIIESIVVLRHETNVGAKRVILGKYRERTHRNWIYRNCIQFFRIS